MFSAFLVGSIVAVNMGSVLAAVQFTGVNIAGFDFGCSTDGTCTTTGVCGALTELNGQDGAGQMAHFTNTDGFNLYRLPVGWQYLVNDVLGGPLDPNYSGDYDKLVQACLATGSHCLIDIHNYARWNGAIIGQGGPTNDQFASLWSQLATKYASESKVLFGLMNEPHDLPDINLWAASVQAAVTAIRTAGATSQIILLPGNDYTSAESFVTGGSAAALCEVANPDGSKTNLVFDVHKYFDSDGSGTSADCVSNQIDTSFSPLATYLRANNRQALLSETGGGSSNPGCLLAVCQALSYLDANSDVYLGYVGWAAGSFAPDYVLSMTPFGSAAAGWTDQELVSQCFAMGATGSNSSTAASASTAGTSLEATVTQATTASVSSTADAVPVSSTSSTDSILTTSFPYTFTAAAATYPDSLASTISFTSSVLTTSFPYSFTAAAATYHDSPASTISTSSVLTTSFPYTFTAAAATYPDSPASTISTSFLSTSFPYTFSAAPVTDIDPPASTISTSSVSTTSFPYTFSAAPVTDIDASAPIPYPDAALSTSFPYTFSAAPVTDIDASAPISYPDAALSPTSTTTTGYTSTTFAYLFSAAPTTISTSPSAGPYGAAPSAAASDTASSSTEMYTFAAAPTTPVGSATPSGFTTVVRPSSTEEAGSEGTGGGGDDGTCSS